MGHKTDQADAKAYYAQQTDLHKKSYEEKYVTGKNLITSTIEEKLIGSCSKELEPDARVLELGYFSGRLNRKLKSYFTNITASDVSEIHLKNYDGVSFVFNLSSKQIKAQDKGKFDAVFSIGHQIAFSANAEQAIINIIRFTKPGGLMVFDIWNTYCKSEFDPPHKLDKISLDKCRTILNQQNVKMISFDAGVSIPYLAPRLYFLLDIILGQKISAQFCKRLEYFIPKSLKLKYCQSIYLTGLKTDNKTD